MQNNWKTYKNNNISCITKFFLHQHTTEVLIHNLWNCILKVSLHVMYELQKNIYCLFIVKENVDHIYSSKMENKWNVNFMFILTVNIEIWQTCHQWHQHQEQPQDFVHLDQIARWRLNQPHLVSIHLYVSYFQHPPVHQYCGVSP